MTDEPNRRRVLAGIGVASAAAVAGCLGGDDSADENGVDEPTDDNGNGADEPEDDGGDDRADEALHERYGYPSTSMEEEQPVEADHVVELLMEAREEGPPEFYFEPAGLAVEAGDVVRFEFQSPDHAVASFHEAFGRTHRCPEDAEPVSSPMMAVGTYWLCSFEEAGVWDLYCPPHEMLGMGMRIVVDDASGGPATEPADPDAEVQARPPEEPLAGTFNAEALDPDTILEDGDVPWDDVR